MLLPPGLVRSFLDGSRLTEASEVDEGHELVNYWARSRQGLASMTVAPE